MQAPIVLFVYNRIDHTRQVLQALNANGDADKSELYIFSDAPADKTEAANVAEVRKYIDTFKSNNHFKNVNIIKAEENKGLETSLIDGITQIINQYGKVIVLEDDQLTSPDFICFMNEALDFYENDNKIWSVTGFTMDLKRLRQYKRDVYCGFRGCCWGWGTWKNRWDKIDWAVSDYDSFMCDRKRQREFNKGGIDMTPMLKLQHEGKIHSWAIRWCYQQYKEQMLTIFPRHSKVQNIGMDGSGTNCGTDSVYHATMKAEKKWNFEYHERDTWVFQEWRNYYAKLWLRQKLGALWYAFTEYEYCLAYRLNKDEKYTVLKPNFREWYTNAVPVDWKNEKYLFMVVFHKLNRQSFVGISQIKTDGTMTKPQKTNIRILQEGFPCVFVNEKQTYMMLASENEVQFYTMEDNITQWKPYCKAKCGENIVNAVICSGSEGKLYVLVNEANEKRKSQSRLALFQLENLNHREGVTLRKVWQQNEYSYAVLNGGNIYEENGKQYRIVRNSSPNVSSEFITLAEITQIDEQGFSEETTRKIGLTSINAELTPFIYRKCGVHSYGKNETCKVVSLWVQRFSLGGLLMKGYRLLRD